MAQINQSLPLPLPSLRREGMLSFTNWLEPHVSWFGRIFMTEEQIMPNPLSQETFLEFLIGHRFVVVHFWAPWNERDRLMERMLASLASDKASQVAFASLNIDLPEHIELARQHKVFDVPLLAFYRDGLLIRTTTGMYSRGVLAKHLRELIGA
jgi:thiol-disulfide isomerase/thioredoxin